MNIKIQVISFNLPSFISFAANEKDQNHLLKKAKIPLILQK